MHPPRKEVLVCTGMGTHTLLVDVVHWRSPSSSPPQNFLPVFYPREVLNPRGRHLPSVWRLRVPRRSQSREWGTLVARSGPVPTPPFNVSVYPWSGPVISYSWTPGLTFSSEVSTFRVTGEEVPTTGGDTRVEKPDFLLTRILVGNRGVLILRVHG